MPDGAKIKELCDQLMFRRIFKTFRMAIHPRKMTLAFLAVLAIGLIGWLMDLSGLQVDRWPDTLLVPDTGKEVGMFRQLYGIIASQVHVGFFALAKLDIPAFIRSVISSLEALGCAFNTHPLWSSIFFALMLVVLSLAGGGICRLAALQFAEGERPGLMDCIRFAFRRFWHLFLSPVAPLALVILIGVFVFVGGLFGNIKYVGEILLGLGMPLVLLFGAFMALLILGTLAGFGLFFPAVAYEDTDCFIAVNNGFRYVFVRPWLTGFYYLLAGVYGMVTYYFVRIVAFGMLWTSYKFLQLGVFGGNAKLLDLWPEPTFVSLVGQFRAEDLQSLPATMIVGRFLIYVCCLAVLGLLVAFCLSFYFTANTIIYALLRKAVDGTAIEKVEREKAQTPTPSTPPQQPANQETGTTQTSQGT
ncbi:MAG: hypothetical protein QHH07_00720 [Sedimentisphaerales bacterium]|jgi:hypothetical protein|nr:hypothetical protein [Sedimentisphaerales bacterium]